MSSLEQAQAPSEATPTEQATTAPPANPVSTPALSGSEVSDSSPEQAPEPEEDVPAPATDEPPPEPLADATRRPAAPPSDVENAQPNPSAPTDAGQPADGTSQSDEPPEEQASSCVTLNLTILDFAGVPIAGLPVQLVINSAGRTVVTDGFGRCPPQSDLLPGSTLEILVQKDDGSWAEKFSGTVAYSDMDMCGVSPHIKIPVTTELHRGAPQPAKTAPSPVSPQPLKPNPPPKDAPKSGGTIPCVKPEPRRNEQGNPIARIKEYFQDWANRIAIPTFGLWTWRDFSGDSKKSTKPLECGPAELPVAQASGQNSGAGTGKPPASAPAPVAAQPRSAPPPVPTQRIVSVTQPPPAQLVRLLDLMEEAATWDFKKPPLSGKNTVDIFKGLASKTLGEPDKKIGVSKGSCYKAVKLGLWRAEYVSGVGGGESPAKSAGTWLLSENFQDVTSTLPDARWAWPGDVIVYRYPKDKAEQNDAAAQEALAKKMVAFQKDQAEYERKKLTFDQAKQDYETAKLAWTKDNPKKPYPHKFSTKPPAPPKKPVVEDVNYGHIDVRSYDSYLSDFKPKSNSLPNALGFEAIGIYRKVSDPLADIRLRAFLKVLREWECHEEPDDAKRYYMLQQPINGSRRFTETSTHPQIGHRTTGTFAGAYQISIQTFNQNTTPESGIPPRFTPAIQDRIATRIIEGRGALGAIRLGDIERAVELLRREWTSLPGGVDARAERRNGQTITFTIDQLVQRHSYFMQEMLQT